MAKNGREANLELVRSEKPDVVLMDIHARVGSVECAPYQVSMQISGHRHWHTLTTFDDDEYVFNAAVRRVWLSAQGRICRGFDQCGARGRAAAYYRAGRGKQMPADVRADGQGNLTIGVDEKQTEDLQDNEWRIIREVGAVRQQGNRGRALPVRRHGAQLSSSILKASWICATARSLPSGRCRPA